MENEIKLVNNVDGSVLSDKVVSSIDKKVDTLNEAAVRIGQLEGELMVANQARIQQQNDTERMLEEAREHMSVSITTESNQVITDRWGDIIKNPSSINYIRVEKTKLNELADAGVKAQALKDVKVAEDKADDAKKKQEKAEKSAEQDVKLAQKIVKDSDKSRKEDIEKAVNQAEKSNLRTIAEQKLNAKVLEKEADLLVDERLTIIKERDFAFEAQEAKLRMKDNLIDILQRDTKTIFESISNRIAYWNYSRKLHRLNS